MRELLLNIIAGLIAIVLAILIIGGRRDRRRLDRMAKDAKPESAKWQSRKGDR